MPGERTTASTLERSACSIGSTGRPSEGFIGHLIGRPAAVVEHHPIGVSAQCVDRCAALAPEAPDRHPAAVERFVARAPDVEVLDVEVVHFDSEGTLT